MAGGFLLALISGLFNDAGRAIPVGFLSFKLGIDSPDLCALRGRVPVACIHGEFGIS